MNSNKNLLILNVKMQEIIDIIKKIPYIIPVLILFLTLSVLELYRIFCIEKWKSLVDYSTNFILNTTLAVINKDGLEPVDRKKLETVLGIYSRLNEVSEKEVQGAYMAINKIYSTTVISLAAVFLFLSCGSTEEEGCRDFDELAFLQSRTHRGVPRGNFTFYIQGDVIDSYPGELVIYLDEFNYWNGLYRLACEDNGRHHTGLHDYYDYAYYYALLLEGVYRRSSNVTLHFDGVSSFIVDVEPVDSLSLPPSFRAMDISDLTVADINTVITLDSTTINRNFRVTYRSDVFSSLATGSSVKMEIHNIRPVGETVLIGINASSTIFNEGGSMESVSIYGTVQAYREK